MMTIEQLRQQMGADATDAEAEAMSQLLRERYSIDIRVDEEEDWEITDSQFFMLIPEAIFVAEDRAKRFRVNRKKEREREK